MGILSVLFLTALVVSISLLLIGFGYTSAELDAEKRLKHVLNVMNDYPLTEGYLDEHLDKNAVWRKCIREVMISYQELSDL